MKALARIFLIAGLITVLTPCACDEIARQLASSCHAPSHDCCGGTGSGIHKTMDQKASMGAPVHVPPPFAVVHAVLDLPVLTAAAVPHAGPAETVHSPPSFNTPLLI